MADNREDLVHATLSPGYVFGPIVDLVDEGILRDLNALSWPVQARFEVPVSQYVQLLPTSRRHARDMARAFRVPLRLAWRPGPGRLRIDGHAYRRRRRSRRGRRW